MHSQSSDVVRTSSEAATDPAGSREVGQWLTHFGRTCKTCRLYDVNNPTVVRFREDLYQGLRTLLEGFGDLTLEITSREMSFRDAVVYRATSRDDNLAGVLHRDGIRRLTFLKEVAGAELDAFVDLILHVTGQSGGEDDIVTLLWEANLPSIAIVAAPLEGDVDGAGEEGAGDAEPLPWPGGADSSPNSTSSGTAESKEAGDEKTRSDDWDVLASLTITSLSVSGVGFTLCTPLLVQSGEHYDIIFFLDDTDHTLIFETIVMRRVQDREEMIS